MFANYFPDSEKKKLQVQFRKLRQGNRSVGEYEREFSHIIDCVPDVVRDDKDRADLFKRGLRPDIYKAMHILKHNLLRRCWIGRCGQSMVMPIPVSSVRRPRRTEERSGLQVVRVSRPETRHRPARCVPRPAVCLHI
uniref:Retrotransposon gag domain-containing protein n=1 Tax=Ananas comosus var. bracteatus TaxID=296719 RepID=A0A6V7NPL3_ANACO|nr:unnamed protein product [Ananas comosus var. bracteatus]